MQIIHRCMPPTPVVRVQLLLLSAAAIIAERHYIVVASASSKAPKHEADSNETETTAPDWQSILSDPIDRDKPCDPRRFYDSVTNDTQAYWKCTQTRQVALLSSSLMRVACQGGMAWRW